MSTECSRETSLRLTISQAVFFSSVLCSSLLRHFDTAHKGYRCLLYSSSSNMIFQIYWVYYVAFLRREKMTGLTSCWLRANTYLEIQHKGTKKNVVKMILFHNLFFSIWQSYRSQFLSDSIFHYHNRPFFIKKFDLDAVCSKAKHCRNVFGHVLRPNFVISTQLVLNVGPWPFL